MCRGALQARQAMPSMRDSIDGSVSVCLILIGMARVDRFRSDRSDDIVVRRLSAGLSSPLELSSSPVQQVCSLAPTTDYKSASVPIPLVSG
jgi:hypothetical protein